MNNSFQLADVRPQLVDDVAKVGDVSTVLAGLQLEVGTLGLLGLELDVQLLAPQHQLLVILGHLVILQLLQVQLIW